MKLIRIVVLVFILVFQGLAEEKININFKDLKISDFIMITSKIINKNILFTDKIEGTMDFIPNKEVSKSDLLKILDLVLSCAWTSSPITTSYFFLNSSVVAVDIFYPL